MKLNRVSLILMVAGPLLALLVVFGIIVLNEDSQIQNFDLDVFNFETCAEKGYPILEIFPRQCRTDDGRIFTEVLQPNAYFLSPDSSVGYRGTSINI